MARRAEANAKIHARPRRSGSSVHRFIPRAGWISSGISDAMNRARLAIEMKSCGWAVLATVEIDCRFGDSYDMAVSIEV